MAFKCSHQFTRNCIEDTKSVIITTSNHHLKIHWQSYTVYLIDRSHVICCKYICIILHIHIIWSSLLIRCYCLSTCTKNKHQKALTETELKALQSSDFQMPIKHDSANRHPSYKLPYLILHWTHIQITS